MSLSNNDAQLLTAINAPSKHKRRKRDTCLKITLTAFGFTQKMTKML